MSDPTSPSCPRCTGPVDPKLLKCRYCGAPFTMPASPESVDSAPLHPPSAPVDVLDRLSAQERSALEFGPTSAGIQQALIAGIGLAIWAGWMLEHPKNYWSNDSACIMWLGGAPLWALIVGSVWRPPLTVGLLSSFTWSGGVFLAGMLVRGHRIGDDALGLTLAVAAAATTAFALGHLIRRRIMRERAAAVVSALPSVHSGD